MDGWNTSFLLGWPIFRGYVSFREGISLLKMGGFTTSYLDLFLLVTFYGELGSYHGMKQISIKAESIWVRRFLVHEFSKRRRESQIQVVNPCCPSTPAFVRSCWIQFTRSIVSSLQLRKRWWKSFFVGFRSQWSG